MNAGKFKALDVALNAAWIFICVYLHLSAADCRFIDGL